MARKQKDNLMQVRNVKEPDNISKYYLRNKTMKPILIEEKLVMMRGN